jgi:flavin reductase (DIM6/NTAB) family NADH-FMN oxidoreductase RutF
MRKPWNLPSYPVYSLLTENRDEKNPQMEIWSLSRFPMNMNVMTYVIPVSMQPKHYIIALYHGTRSLENWQSSHSGILQILAPDHSSLVRVLGKKSGKSYDKMGYLEKKWLLMIDHHLKGSAWYIELEEIEKLSGGGGDHELYLCRVKSAKGYHEDVLTTEILVEEGVIL